MLDSPGFQVLPAQARPAQDQTPTPSRGQSRRSAGIPQAIFMALLSACVLSSSGCGSVQRVFSPYRADIGQGNFISQEQVNQLKLGMSRDQVRLILGTPLLEDPFRADRWDYLFDIRRGNGEPNERRSFVVRFEKDQLVSWQGDQMPPKSGDLLLPLRPGAK